MGEQLVLSPYFRHCILLKTSRREEMPNMPGLPETDIEVHALYDKTTGERICGAFPVPVTFMFADPDPLLLVTDLDIPP